MNIFVANLEKTVTAHDLRLTFSGYGTVINAIVMKDTASGQPLGHAHVYLVPEQSAREAIEELNQAPLKGRPILMRECIYRAKRDRRSRRAAELEAERRRMRDRRRMGSPLDARP